MQTILFLLLTNNSQWLLDAENYYMSPNLDLKDCQSGAQINFGFNNNNNKKSCCSMTILNQFYFLYQCLQATWCHLATVVCHFLSNCVSLCNFCNYRIQVWSKTLSTISKKTPKQKPILFLLSYCSIFGDI